MQKTQTWQKWYCRRLSWTHIWRSSQPHKNFPLPTPGYLPKLLTALDFHQANNGWNPTIVHRNYCGIGKGIWPKLLWFARKVPLITCGHVRASTMRQSTTLSSLTLQTFRCAQRTDRENRKQINKQSVCNNLYFRFVVIHGLPPDWKRPLGRPSHTWLREVEADLSQQNIGLASAWRKAAIHDNWQCIVYTATLQRRTLWKKKSFDGHYSR